MEYIKKQLKEKYRLSNYQIAQLTFLFKTLLSEISKIIIMGFLFQKKLSLYLFVLFIMLFLRCSTGGLHFYTYWGCLACSVIYIGLAIFILPSIVFPPYIRIGLLFICMLICYFIGPVVSKYRPTPTSKLYKRGKNTTCIFIILYTLILYFVPENIYITGGFWTIILHSLQLIVAKIRKKGD